MNLELFRKLMKLSPTQYLPEWKMFLGICEIYLKEHEIENPIVLELGTERNEQKKFYEQLLGATHIGIDHARKWGRPDIYREIRDPRTMEILKEKLNGRSINILFIDASHLYEETKKDFETFSPLCSDIIAFHDIDNCRHKENKKIEVWKFWDELKLKARDFLFISIHQHRCARRSDQMGIGVMIKR